MTNSRQDKYFGLAHFKQEGAPMHPDDMNWDYDDPRFKEAYERQLKAYNDHYKINEEKQP